MWCKIDEYNLCWSILLGVGMKKSSFKRHFVACNQMICDFYRFKNWYLKSCKKSSTNEREFSINPDV